MLYGIKTPQDWQYSWLNSINVLLKCLSRAPYHLFEQVHAFFWQLSLKQLYGYIQSHCIYKLLNVLKVHMVFTKNL